MNAPPILIQDGSPLSKEDQINLREKDTVIEVSREEDDFKNIVVEVSVFNQNICVRIVPVGDL